MTETRLADTTNYGSRAADPAPEKIARALGARTIVTSSSVDKLARVEADIKVDHANDDVVASLYSRTVVGVPAAMLGNPGTISRNALLGAAAGTESNSIALLNGRLLHVNQANGFVAGSPMKSVLAPPGT